MNLGKGHSIYNATVDGINEMKLMVSKGFVLITSSYDPYRRDNEMDAISGYWCGCYVSKCVKLFIGIHLELICLDNCVSYPTSAGSARVNQS